MKREVYLVLTVLSLLLLSSCGMLPAAGRDARDTSAILQQVKTGTQGVEVTLVANLPPNTIYDQNPLTALVEVRNRGNYNLQPQDCFIQIVGQDNNIIRGLQTARSCGENSGVLEGKNEYNVEGGYNQIEFTSTSVSLPNNVYEITPTLNFLACYNYHTKASPQICVDPLLFEVTAQQKTCTPRDVGMAGGQGAPVGVNLVGVDMVGSKAIFEINIANFGTGRVLSPNAPIQSCGQSSLSYTDLDKVQYNVQLTGGSLVDCKPRDGFVRLVNNNGKIVCTFNIPGGSAYETPLLIDLSYGYVQSLLKPIRIVKTPGS
ncbi:MAG TPA: hypothetical protein VJI98_05225 [Candidatus Nanoarchaeia archaeon]|nr:hypothetical protein [Candidatus Nanoarchaeia archaeon]